MASPYGASPVVSGITWDWANRTQAATGSDEWPACWADDDKLYVAWGDGGGFGGTDSDGRVMLGVGSVSGSGDSWTGHNIWGGKTPDTPASFSNAKSTGMLCIGGRLWMWVQKDVSGDPRRWMDARVHWSDDHGLTWHCNHGDDDDWDNNADFVLVDGLMGDFAFITYGKDYAGARDGFVYGYTIETQALLNASQPCYSYNLARVPIAHIARPGAYRYYAGCTSCGNPIWSPNIADREPVFTDPAGVTWGQRCWYHPGLGRYFLSVMRTESADWGIFDAPEPWGPWTTVAYYTDWQGSEKKVCYGFNSKWVSGNDLWMIVSDYTTSRGDGFTVVKGTLTLV